jgi:hypothetical protein
MRSNPSALIRCATFAPRRTALVVIKAALPRTAIWLTVSTLLLSGAVLSGCGGSSTESKQVSQAVTANRLGITSTYLQENNGYVHINGSQQFRLLGIDGTGAVIDLSERTIWRLSDSSFGSITSKGLFTPKGIPGEMVLTAEFAGQVHTQPLIVSNADLVSITVSAETPVVSVCQTATVAAEALFDNGLALSYPFHWSVNPASELASFPDPSVPRLATYKSGPVNVVASGTSNAGADIQSPPVTIDIIDNLSSLALTATDPAPDSNSELRIRQGEQITLAVTATYLDGSSANITPNAQLSVHPATGGSIDDAGRFTAQNGSYEGTRISLSGSCNDELAELAVFVLKPQLDTIDIKNPNSNAPTVSLTEGNSARLLVTADYVDDLGQDDDYRHNLEWRIDESRSDNFDRDRVTLDDTGRLATSRELNLTTSLRLVVRARVLDDNGVPLLNRAGETLEDTIDVLVNPRDAT